jgi:hypothetical protein
MLYIMLLSMLYNMLLNMIYSMLLSILYSIQRPEIILKERIINKPSKLTLHRLIIYTNLELTY